MFKNKTKSKLECDMQPTFLSKTSIKPDSNLIQKTVIKMMKCLIEKKMPMNSIYLGWESAVCIKSLDAEAGHFNNTYLMARWCIY